MPTGSACTSKASATIECEPGIRVRADLALTHRYGIRVQELPLLCRGILERRKEDEAQQTFTYTGVDMRLNVETSASRAADAEKRRAPRKPPSQNVGATWRGSHV